jgi:hypothetical protein
MLKLKFSYNLRNRKQVALFDASGISLFSKYIDQRDISIIDIDHMNVFAVLRMLLSGKKSFFDYSIAYIKIFKPKFVFTFIDNNVDFYKIASIFLKSNLLRSKMANEPTMQINLDVVFLRFSKESLKKANYRRMQYAFLENHQEISTQNLFVPNKSSLVHSRII